MEDVQPLVSDALSDALVAVGIVAVGLLAALMRFAQKKLEEYTDVKLANTRWHAATDKLHEATANAVDAVEQTVVRRLREVQADVRTDQRLNGVEARTALDAAVSAAKLHIGPDAWVEILQSLQLTPERGEELLRQMLEAKVGAKKPTQLVTAIVPE